MRSIRLLTSAATIAGGDNRAVKYRKTDSELADDNGRLTC